MKIRFAVGPPGGPLAAADLVTFAVALEQSGFDGIWLSDLPVAPVIDPPLALALLAGRTATLRLGANIVPFGRSPYVLAKTLAQLDQVSDGRLLLSFVTGIGQAGERDALGLSDADWGVLLEQVLGRVRAYWTGGPDDGSPPPGIPSAALAATRPLQDPLGRPVEVRRSPGDALRHVGVRGAMACRGDPRPPDLTGRSGYVRVGSCTVWRASGSHTSAR